MKDEGKGNNGGSAAVVGEAKGGPGAEGPRILAQIHSTCTSFRIKVKDTLVKLKAQEFAEAKVCCQTSHP